MKWIEFFQTPYDRVKFTTNELMPETTSLGYHKFRDYVLEQCPRLKRKGDFMDALDSYQTVVIDVAIGEWEIMAQDRHGSRTYDFDELVKLDAARRGEAEEGDMLKTAKNAINKLWNLKKRGHRRSATDGGNHPRVRSRKGPV